MFDQLYKHLFAYKNLKKAWIATGKDGDIECDNEEYDRFDAAEFALISYPCKAPEEARVKSRIFAQDAELMETIATTRTPEGKKYLVVFLESLWPVDDVREIAR